MVKTQTLRQTSIGIGPQLNKFTHSCLYTVTEYSIVNNSATDKLFVAVILGIYINYTSHSQLIGH